MEHVSVLSFSLPASCVLAFRKHLHLQRAKAPQLKLTDVEVVSHHGLQVLFLLFGVLVKLRQV
jgi:hypothetical protein